ncbi:uncharacterized protein LOC121989648 isoform X1 [Zingiber officinale]|nr:uncharacterized protein LOC121989648 isoform X1 [Zingiber officinale]XP_042399754.1 uncharacterized protein LOC121989648 isoform X1 [Zingiber officinale]
MVKFSRLFSSLPIHKSKKVVQEASGTMQCNSAKHSEDQEIKLTADEFSSSVSQLEKITAPCLLDTDCKEDDCSEDSQELHFKAQKAVVLKAKIRKSKSVGNILDEERGSPYNIMIQKNESEARFLSHGINQTGSISGKKLDEYHTDYENCSQKQILEFTEFAEPVQHECLFSIGIHDQSNAEYNDYADDESPDYVSYEQLSSNGQFISRKSCSLTNLGGQTIDINDGTLKLEPMGPHSNSVENLLSVDFGRGLFSDGNAATASRVVQKTELHYISDCSESNELSDSDKDGKCSIMKSNSGNQLVDIIGSPCDMDSGETCHHSNYNLESKEIEDQEREGGSCSEKIIFDVSSADENCPDCSDQPDSAVTCGVEEPSVENLNGSSPENCNINRIASWISQLDVQNCNYVKELGKNPHLISDKVPSKKASKVGSKKLDAKSSIGMIAAYNYISSLSPASSSAQMTNLGLVATPVLSSFVNLKMLNLSGNFIVRITSGSLPKGLHMLNLSKNHISAIEGLKELTRLRVLDLSYNKISRIGHGLASCSSLKELYLAGNKISEVEGLHRLLKLTVLDLRSNRIATSKGLGQLAANYASLQAVILEGNPAQKNVGDEQLKKCLHYLLPRLAYYNRQPIRASGSKDVTDRSSRSFSTHQFDRAFRSKHKDLLHGNKSSYGRTKSVSALNSLITSSRNKHKSVTSKPTNNLPSAKPQGLVSDNPLRRIQSEGSF